MSEDKSQMKEAFRANRVCVVVPTYNNANTLATVLNHVLEYTDQIIVVNDGSTDSTTEVLKSFSISLVSYERNEGKGFAIRSGFKKAVELGYDYAITIDSDGQHFADDLPTFINELPLHRNAIIIGARNMEQSSVPGKSSFGNKFSNFWFWVETGLRMPDTQSGFRLYPIKALQTMSFITRKYEFEIEVLVRAAWSGIEVTSVPIKVFYADKAVRVSHFRPFTDFSRISVLNTVLVTIALLYIKPRDFFRSFKGKNFAQVLRDHILSPHHSNRLKAVSIGFGVFIGIIPIWGFQSVVALALAVVLRLNKVLVLIGSNVSFPPFIPAIIYGSVTLGSFVLNEPMVLPALNSITLDFALQSVGIYIVGSFVLAVVAGTLLGLLSYLLLELTKKKPESPNQNTV
jgi:glycosyltransferase involved in cell wall biosynthesis